MPYLKRLKGLRVEFGLTQADMAEYLGISKNSYHRKETGLYEFSLSESMLIAKLFNKPIDEIFFKQEVTETITKDNKNH